MKEVYYIGLDIHKKIIAFCIKTVSGVTVSRGTVAASPSALLKWVEILPQPWIAAMEATLFTGWVYDFLKPYAKELPKLNQLPRLYPRCSKWMSGRSTMQTF